ncbi:MAG TPA: SDR family oxidoreductase [Chloroflexota bacterium]
MTTPVSQQVVVITGATSGVGRACAQAFGSYGARVGLIARGEEALRAAATEIEQAGGEALPLPLDVASSDAVEQAAAAVEQRWGRIDTWVNDAMVSVFSPAMQMTMEEIRRVTEVNYLGCVYGTMAALKRMRKHNEGAIIQICSALAYRSIPLQSAYCATKAAQRAFSDSVRTELLHDGSHVRVSVLILPAVNTPQFDVVRTRLPRHPQPVPPIYQPEVIAEAVLYAAEHPVREMVIGGGALKAVIGQKLIPGLLDRYLARTGFDSQQTHAPIEPGRPDNLFAPLPGDPGAHGDFDSRSRSGSLQLWLRTHRKLLAAGATAAMLAGLAQRLHRPSTWNGTIAASTRSAAPRSILIPFSRGHRVEARSWMPISLRR